MGKYGISLFVISSKSPQINKTYIRKIKLFYPEYYRRNIHVTKHLTQKFQTWGRHIKTLMG